MTPAGSSAETLPRYASCRSGWSAVARWTIRPNTRTLHPQASRQAGQPNWRLRICHVRWPPVAACNGVSRLSDGQDPRGRLARPGSHPELGGIVRGRARVAGGCAPLSPSRGPITQNEYRALGVAQHLTRLGRDDFGYEVRVVRADDDQLIDVCALLEQIGYVIRYRKCGDVDVDVVWRLRAVAVELRPATLVILGFRASCGRRRCEGQYGSLTK